MAKTKDWNMMSAEERYEWELKDEAKREIELMVQSAHSYIRWRTDPQDLVNSLTASIEAAGKQGLNTLVLDVESVGLPDDTDYQICIIGKRLETDKEFEKRLTDKKKLFVEGEASERRDYERLRSKFEAQDKTDRKRFKELQKKFAA